MEFEMPGALPLLCFLNLLGQNGKVPQQVNNLKRKNFISGLSWARKALPFQPNCTYQAAECPSRCRGKRTRLGALRLRVCEQPGTEGVVSVRVCHGGRGVRPCLPPRPRCRRHRSGERSSRLGGTSFAHPPKFC